MKKGTLKECSLRQLAALDERLQLLEQEKTDIKDFAREAFAICRENLQLLKQQVAAYTFSGPPEEIDFFRHIKPLFSAKLIYYYRLFHFYAAMPRWGRRQRKAHFRKELKTIQLFFADHHYFCIYYNAGSTYLDDQYFVRGHDDISLLPADAMLLYDDTFSASHDAMVAIILAYDQLEEYLLDALRTQKKHWLTPGRAMPWTGYKAALIEMIYSLYWLKIINNGKTPLRQIVEGFQILFGINLGNYSDLLDDFRARKNSPALFLDELKEAFIKHLYEKDG